MDLIICLYRRASGCKNLAMENKIQQPQKTIQTMKFIWCALFAMPFIYGFVLFNNQKDLLPPDQTFILMIGFVAAATLVLSLVLPEMIFRSQVKKLQGEVSNEDAFKMYLITFMIRLVLSESISTFGLIVALRSGLNFYFPFFAVSVVSLLAAFPIENQIKEKIDKARLS